MARLKEECGVFGIFDNKDAAALTALGLHALQHRGQEGCGIVTSNGKNFYAERRLGLVGDNFTKGKVLEKLPGNYAIGHNRYSTSGNNLIKNVQPFFADLHAGGISIAHNGNLSNARHLRRELVKNGSIFQTTSDTETIVQLIAQSKRPKTIDKIIDALFRIQGGYALTILINKKLIGIRDPFGIRPLIIGKLNKSYVLASETCALDIIGAKFIREVNNGEIPARQLENNHREYTEGFHLVGNPYPSPIDWNAANGWTRDNIDDGIYFFTASDDNQYTGTYTAFVNDISTGDSNVDGSSENIIPSMQGFFIKVSDSDTQDLITGSFGMDNRVRTNNFNQEFYRSQLPEQKSLLRLEAGFKGANRKDAMVIYFSTYATPNFEKEMDAHKLMNTDPAVPSFYNIFIRLIFIRLLSSMNCFNVVTGTVITL